MYAVQTHMLDQETALGSKDRLSVQRTIFRIKTKLYRVRHNVTDID